MSQKSARDARKKGDLVEEIAAQMHEGPGVSIQTKVRLPPVNTAADNKFQKREIDILITASIAGYSVQIAIECKNERKPIDAPYIDAFVGKLLYVGIPTKQGVFIATSPYTKGARQRAEIANITLLNLTGLTEDRLSKAVFGAVQSVIHLLLEVNELRLTSSNQSDEYVVKPGEPFDEAAYKASYHPPILYDEDKNPRGILPDLVWRMWRDGKLPTALGQYEISVEVPKGWYQFVQGDNGEVPDPLLELHAKVTVFGFIVTLQGVATQNILVDVSKKSVQKGNVNVRFDTGDTRESNANDTADDVPNNTPDETPTTTLRFVHTEEELATYLAEQEKDKMVGLVIGRLQLPRIVMFGRYGRLFWPPSEATVFRLKALADEYGPFVDPTPEQLGPDPFGENHIDAVWEPIWSGYRLPE